MYRRIGEISSLRARIRIHKKQVLDLRLRHLYVNHHIVHCVIAKSTLFKITPFFSVNLGDKIYRKGTEQPFIKMFRPELNRD